MNQKLQNILDIIKQSEKLDAEQKNNLVKAVKDADKELEITAFKLERTEKVKKTTAILLEETIEELEQKRKAVEAQNRELEIEATLERVRRRAMAMHNSNDVGNATAVMFSELEKLGINTIRCGILIVDESKIFEVWAAATSGEGKIVQIIGKLDSNIHPLLRGVYKAWKEKESFFTYELKGKDINDYYSAISSAPDYNVPAKEDTLQNQFCNVFFFKEGGLFTYTLEQFSNEAIQVLKRFAAVFGLTYRRYLDLQKAEAQAREAQIEAALERVRARSMAMHHTSELQEVVNKVAQQLHKMEMDITGGVFITINDEIDKELTFWGSSGVMESYVKKTSVPFLDRPIYTVIIDANKKREGFLVEEYTREEKMELFEHMFKYPPYNSSTPEWKREILSRGGGYTRSVAISRYTSIFIINHQGEKFSDADNEILKRFGKVFEQSYIRFLDLQKAETQAREAQIEAALERIRSRTNAMRKSEELQEVILLVFKQLKHLNVSMDASYINIYPDDTRDINVWIADENEDYARQVYIPFYDGPLGRDRNEALNQGKPLYSKTFSKEIKDNLFEYLFKHTDLKYAPENRKKFIMEGPGFSVSIAFKKYTSLWIVRFRKEPFSKEENEILKRFATVFEQTYTRFLDLQKAEAQAKEAIKQASLDRIRGEIASMRTVEDLNRITPIIWRELKTLEVPFIRCGVFIIDEEQEKTRVYLTTPDGKSLGVLNLAFDENDLTKKTVEHWKKKQVYKDHWNKEQFINWTKSMMELGQVQNAETYQGSANPPESLNLHFVPFTQGMLYVGDTSPLTDEKLELVKTLAEAFSIAYARYEDFNNLEEAKNKIEMTLTELKSAQAQLVHSEKMASLGELTAGIAHEIKNPLNFVNNFSEISGELLDEIKEELEKNNKEEILAILEDLKQNLEKINQHGKRADSIVKGMLLHSRGSSGEKALTDINDLLDQYVNLAYHGMRAQNKEFNITIEKDFDETLEKINVVPQDISRVFLNIINNACYAAYEKKEKSSDNNYSPTLRVSTKQLDRKVEIRISDNGNGIRADILDKIFQPFFTTKPTGEGTGLGLSLSYDIITKVHGGDLKFETKEGEGTEFIIQLSA